MKLIAFVTTVTLALSLGGCSTASSPTAAEPEAPALSEACYTARWIVKKVEKAYEESYDGTSFDRIAWTNLYFFVSDQNAPIDKSSPDASTAAWFLDNYGDCLTSESYDMVAYWRDNFAN